MTKKILKGSPSKNPFWIDYKPNLQTKLKHKLEETGLMIENVL